MVTGIKKTVFRLIDKVLTQGTVLEVRPWSPGSLYEIDLHLPQVNMAKWTTIPRLKIKVADPGEYRDYTPASWNVEKRTCTLCIETAHLGFGSAWAKSLRPGDPVLFSPAHATGLPARPGKVACFGDGSALGHFLALKQLTDRPTNPIQAFVFLNDQYMLPEQLVRSNPEFTFIMQPGANSLDTLSQVAEMRSWADLTSVYIAGHIPMVTGMRKVLKSSPQFNARIFANGFWR